MIEIIRDIDQGSEAWRQARLGIPTASMFATVMAKGRDGGVSLTRSKYLRELAGEILTGDPAESYSNGHMERGKEQESEARDLYAFLRDAEPELVGFIRNGAKGASPDSLIGSDGGLEIKTALPHIQIERLTLGRLPPEYVAQVQGNMWVAERAWWDFVSYCPKLPPLIVRVTRDDLYVANLTKAVAAFNEELEALVSSIRTYENFAGQAA